MDNDIENGMPESIPVAGPYLQAPYDGEDREISSNFHPGVNPGGGVRV